jgi:methionyl-tRNA formyltransferase
MLKVCLFFNNTRGLKVYSLLKKKKIEILKIFLSKKFLNNKIINKINNFEVISSVNSKKVLKFLSLSDIAIVAGFPYIFNKKSLHAPKFGIINCHAGILPKYRGGSPLNWQIINGEKKFGITVLKMSEQIDAGMIIKEKKFPLKKSYDINHLHKIVNNYFPKLVLDSLKKIKHGKKFKKQKLSKSYFRQRNKKDSLIKFENLSFQNIKNYIRALKKPFPEPFFVYQGKNQIIKDIKKVKKNFYINNLTKIKKKYYVRCKDKVIEVLC